MILVTELYSRLVLQTHGRKETILFKDGYNLGFHVFNIINTLQKYSHVW